MNKTASGQASQRHKQTSSKLRKRKLFPPQPYDDMLADDIKRAEKKVRLTAQIRKRKSEVVLGELSHSRVKPNLLGPVLTRRFMEADNSRMVQ